MSEWTSTRGWVSLCKEIEKGSLWVLLLWQATHKQSQSLLA